MRIYQVRISVYGTIDPSNYGMTRLAFSSHQEALTRFRRACKDYQDLRHRISLYQVDTPDLVKTDWIEILQDGGIPRIQFERLEYSKQLEIPAAKKPAAGRRQVRPELAARIRGGAA